MSIKFVVLHGACEAFDIDAITTIPPLVDALDQQSKSLAADESLRIEAGQTEPSLWPHLHRIWLQTASAHKTVDDQDDEARTQLQSLCLSVARFTRNLVAAVPKNQRRAFENEPAIRDLVRYYTSYYVMQNAESFPVTRMLAQTLSNLVTANDGLMTDLWNSYLYLPEEQLILLRLLGVPDAKTAMSTFVLVLNCIDASPSRMKLLTSTPAGLRLCISFLDRMASLFEDEDAADSSQAFDVGYHIFCRMGAHGAIPAVYEGTAVSGEVVTPHQTTLLKLLDSYLQPSQAQHVQLSNERLTELCAVLITGFFALSEYAQQSITRAVGAIGEGAVQPAREYPSEDGKIVGPADTSAAPSTESSPLNELDLLLPKVSEALVLVTQCLISLALYSEEHLDSCGRIQSGPRGHTSEAADEPALADYVNGAVSRSGSGSIECLIETLRAFDRFLPRITFGKVAPAPVPVPADGAPQRMPPAPDADNGAGRAADPKGFAYLKRDLVRLLGILSSGRRAVQDRVRACGGLQVVLNLCVVDDRNPYLREHAIFTLRNLLHGNAENQALVNEIQPLREWDESGVLQAAPRVG